MKIEVMPGEEYRAMKSFSKAVAISAGLYVEFGDFKMSTELLLTGTRLNDAISAAQSSLMDGLVAIADKSIITSAIRKACSDPRFPVQDCRTLLSAIGPAPKIDAVGAQAIAMEFREESLKILTTDPRTAPRGYYPGTYEDIPFDEVIKGVTDPKSVPKGYYENKFKRLPLVGTYDALETARILGNATSVMMANFERPLSQYDRSADDFLDREAKRVPEKVDPQKPPGFSKWWDELNYRVKMDTTDNTIGRALFPDLILDEVVKSSCKSRAERDLTRVSLASRVYRSLHAGKLPVAPSGFLPLLGAWPTDPYNGKPMIYLPEKEVVYCVGPDLVDHGGDIGRNPGSGKDVGVSLKIQSNLTK